METNSSSSTSNLPEESNDNQQIKSLEYHQSGSFEGEEALPREYPLCLTTSPNKNRESSSVNETVKTTTSGFVKRHRDNGDDVVDDGSDQSAAEERRHVELSPPVKRSRAKKMQGLTFEQAEFRRSRTNEQERERQRNISEALEALRRCDMPFNPYLNHKEESKIYLLKTATAYIYGLVRMLDDHDRGLVHHCDLRLPPQPQGAAVHSGAPAPQFGAHIYFNAHSESVSISSPNASSPGSQHFGLHTLSNQGPAATVEELNSQQSRDQNCSSSQWERLNRQAEEHFKSFLRPFDSPFARVSNATFDPTELQDDVSFSHLDANLQSSYNSPFSNSLTSYTPDYKNNQGPGILNPVSPFHFLNDSPMPQNLSGRSMFDDVLMRVGTTGDPSLHSTPKPCYSTSSGDKQLQSVVEKSVTSSLKEQTFVREDLMCASSKIDSSANSSGYQSMVSAHGDDDSKSFSPDRLHQTIDEMYSETFLAPSPTKRIHFDAF